MEPLDRVFAKLPKKDRVASSSAILDKWVYHAAGELGLRADRVGWILSSTIVLAALGRATDENGDGLFLLKGGVLLERLFGSTGRETHDLDTMFRKGYAELASAIDEAFSQNYGPITLIRTDFELIQAPKKHLPVRFDVLLQINGRTWRKIQVEVSFPEGKAADVVEKVNSTPTEFFGIESPGELVTIAMDYQVAQKLHACTDLHEPPDNENSRVRDIVDILLIRDAFYVDADLSTLKESCQDIFDARAEEAKELDRAPRFWPPKVASNVLWETTYQRPADQVGLRLALDEAIEELNRWIAEIDAT